MKPSELLRMHFSDKETHHNYGKAYDDILSPYRETAQAVLEIGILEGCSIRAWRDYFTSAKIIGMDNDPSRLFQDEAAGIRSIHCDTTDRDGFMRICRDLPVLDVIIDDASHVFNEQVFAVAALWGRLRSGGMYVIEDIYLPEYLSAFGCFQNATLMDLRIPGGCADDMMAILRKP